jgi:hypothetical protein
MRTQTYRYPVFYKGMYWYGSIANSAATVMVLREVFLNFSFFRLPEYGMMEIFLVILFYIEYFMISRLLHLGETVSVNEAEIQYHHSGGKTVTIRWDEISQLEYLEISCVFFITAPNSTRVIKIDNRMGKFGELIMGV